MLAPSLSFHACQFSLCLAVSSPHGCSRPPALNRHLPSGLSHTPGPRDPGRLRLPPSADKHGASRLPALDLASGYYEPFTQMARLRLPPMDPGPAGSTSPVPPGHSTWMTSAATWSTPGSSHSAQQPEPACQPNRVTLSPHRQWDQVQAPWRGQKGTATAASLQPHPATP